MHELTLWDHVFALLVFLAFPVYAKFTIGGLIQTLRTDGERARIGAYRQVIATWAIFAGCTLGLWGTLERPWADLGLRLVIDWPNWQGLGAAALVVALVVLPIRNIANTPARHDELPALLGDVAEFMPQTEREENWFRLVSLNAGITEELIYRGYLIWYLQQALNTTLAAVIAVLAFGLAHWYQGLRQLPGILFISSVAVALYLYTESLIVPILFHVVLDALQGHYIAQIRRTGAITA